MPRGGARTAARRWTRGARRYAYEVEAEAAAEAVDLFPRLRRWYQGDRGPFPADASALRGWPHYAPLRKAFLLERERADAAEAAKRRREAAEERVRSKREAESLAAAAAEAKSATLVGGVADEDDDAADAAPTRRTALAKGTLILIKGLTKNADLNGRSGVIAAEYDEVKGRYAVAFADKSYTIRWQNVDVHPAQKLRDKLPKGDEVVFVSEEEQREGMHARPRLEREDGAPTPIKKKTVSVGRPQVRGQARPAVLLRQGHRPRPRGVERVRGPGPAGGAHHGNDGRQAPVLCGRAGAAVSFKRTAPAVRRCKMYRFSSRRVSRAHV